MLKPDSAQAIYKIIGDSHVSTLHTAKSQYRMALEKSGWKLQSVTMMGAADVLYEPFHKFNNGKIVITHDLVRKRFGEMCDENGAFVEDKSTVLLLSLGMHTQTFLLGRRWVTHSLWSAEGAASRQRLSDAAFRAMFVDINRHGLAFMRDLKKAGYGVICISSPPITKRYSLLEMGYSASDLVLMDNRCREIMIDELSQLDIKVILPPQHTIFQNFLKSKYLMDNIKDRHHGNTHYSLEMLKKIALTLGYELVIDESKALLN